jgi:alpha,alpha-trehalase
VRQARNNAENIIHVIESQGFFPNVAKQGITRSQPAFAAHIIRDLYQRTRDRVFLRRGLAAMEREYAFWSTLRTGPDGLFVARPHAPPQELERFYYGCRDRIVGIPAEPVERLRFLLDAMANAEAGCDFSPRFEHRCTDFYPLIIDVPVYTLECDAAWACAELGDEAGRVRWQARADAHLATFQRLMWNEERGLFIEYDHRNRRPARLAGAETFMPLWAGMATPEQARRVHDNLGLFERAHGITTVEPGERDQRYQWDDPNGWPPLQEFAFVGLDRYGYTEAARRIAGAYVGNIVRSFEQTGQLWEKYNVHTGGIDVVDEYRMPAMIDWTAGVFNVACDYLGVPTA